LAFGQADHPDQRKSLSEQEQAKLLSKREATILAPGTFDSYCSLFYAMKDVAIHTEDHAINERELQQYFPSFYKPTWKELFDAVAIQTGSSWKYDPKRDFWVFSKPAMAKPFSVTIADKWTSRDMGVWMGYAPTDYPVGMDIYYFGTYSSDDNRPEMLADLWLKVTSFWAVNFASKVKPGVTPAEMKTVTVAGVDALYFEAPAPRRNVIWRQWVFVKDGKAFYIISTLDADDKKSLADVQAMIKSFRVTSQQ
jgi:hypothetical protein